MSQYTHRSDMVKAISSVSLAELPSGNLGIAALINGVRGQLQHGINNYTRTS